MNKFASVLILGALALTACQNGEGKEGNSLVDKEAAISSREIGEKSAPLTETEIPNRPATKEAADVETEDLETLKAQLNSLSGDITRLKTGLNPADDPVRAATIQTVPDTQISTPRALVTDGTISIPDSKSELADIRKTMVSAVRVGVHEDKTRLVLESDRPFASKPTVMVTGKTLTIQMVETKWPQGSAQTSGLSDQIGVFNVTEDKDDTAVTVALNAPMTLKSQMVLPPATPGGPHRLVIDLVPAP